MSAPSKIGLSLWAAGQSAGKDGAAASLLTGRSGSDVAVRTYSTSPTDEQRAQVLARYADKLKQKAKDQGFKDVSELKTAYGGEIDKLKRSQAIPDAVRIPDELPAQSAAGTSAGAGASAAAANPARSSQSKPPGVPTLDTYLDLDKIRALPAEEVGQLWRLRHSNNANSLAAVIPADSWADMLAKAQKHPQFILPLPRQVSAEQAAEAERQDQTGPGAELHFLQWTFPDRVRTSILFTHLAEYKVRGEFSAPHTTLTVHTDLADSHKIVLLHGNVMPDRAITTDDARFLLWGVQNFYGQLGQGIQARADLLEAFTSGDVANFDVQVLLGEVEKLA